MGVVTAVYKPVIAMQYNGYNESELQDFCRYVRIKRNGKPVLGKRKKIKVNSWLVYESGDWTVYDDVPFKDTFEQITPMDLS